MHDTSNAVSLINTQPSLHNKVPSHHTLMNQPPLKKMIAPTCQLKCHDSQTCTNVQLTMHQISHDTFVTQNPQQTKLSVGGLFKSVHALTVFILPSAETVGAHAWDRRTLVLRPPSQSWLWSICHTSNGSHPHLPQDDTWWKAYAWPTSFWKHPT